MKSARLSLALALGLLLVFAGVAPLRAEGVSLPLAQVSVPAPVPATATPAPDSFAIKSPAPRDALEAPSKNLLQLVEAGGWAMYPLAFLSVLSIMLIIVFLFTLRRGAILSAHFMNTADVLLKKRDYLGLLAISSRHSEVIARVVQRTLDFSTKHPNAPFQSVRDIAETEGGSQSASLLHRVTYLADIGVLSPMVGLLGTVSGIIRAFAKLGSGEASISRDILLAGGVSEALIATFAGLVLGIVSMGFYGLFRNRAHSLISDLEIGTAHVMGLLAVHHGKKNPSRAVVEEEY
ncbi:MAG TPA: MotA/TolQ/ExbB proton channel family protein [Chthoniobacteraceae bacterium]|jgi:biopolymer transport protein ExbB|nr:MotA/TolQ/ExbB proton channel family protein [Chthoniobacteraceae bacterium]